MILERKAEATDNHLQKKQCHSNTRCSDLEQRMEKIYDRDGGNSEQMEVFRRMSVATQPTKRDVKSICLVVIY